MDNNSFEKDLDKMVEADMEFSKESLPLAEEVVDEEALFEQYENDVAENDVTAPSLEWATPCCDECEMHDAYRMKQ